MKLKSTEKKILETLFEMSSGYVLDFSDRTMSDFFDEEFEIAIYDKKYDFDFPSKSKANRLRGIWLYEQDETVGKIILALLDYRETSLLAGGREIPENTRELLKKAREIANELQQSTPPIVENNTPQITPEELVQKIAEEFEDDAVKIREKRDLLIKLREYHQAYIDVLEIFCAESTKPNDKLNTAYTKLAHRIPELISQLGLQHYKVGFYRPFSDLYSAESDFELFENTKIEITWNGIRPRLYKTHSDITRLVTIAEQDLEMSNDEKDLEDVSALVSSYRVSPNTQKDSDNVQKMEVLHRYEDTGKRSEKIKLSDYDVSFDDETATLSVGRNLRTKFPQYKSEHLILQHMFACRKDEAIDWELVYETISGHTQDKVNKEDVQRFKKKVSDAVTALNKRISETCNTDSVLISMKDKALIRHYGP